MSQFLQNLINRHKAVDVSGEVSREASPIVQPRPKSKFEMNTGSGFFGQNDFNNNDGYNSTSQSGLESESFSTQHKQDSGPVKTVESKQSLRPAQVSVQHSIDKPIADSGTSHLIENLNERIKTATRQPEQKTAGRKTSRQTADKQNDKATEHLVENAELSGHLIKQLQSIPDEISHRIKTIRHRLNSQQSQPADDPRAVEPPHEPTRLLDTIRNTSANELNHRIQTNPRQLGSQQTQNTDDEGFITTPFESISDVDFNASARQFNSQQSPSIDGQRAIESQQESAMLSDIKNNVSASSETNHRIATILDRLNSQQQQHENDRRSIKSSRESVSDADHHAPTQTTTLPLIAEQISSLAQPVIVNVKKQSEESRSEQQEAAQSGLMQIPGWLTEMQADLNNRLRQMSAKAQPEPVINVTIGRVEVKAVQAEVTKKPKSRNKPSGVMGLDEYLKQRENRGRG